MEHFRYVDHTGDLGMEIYGSTLAALFEHAGEGFTDIITDPSTVEASTEVAISLNAPDREQLLVEWLTELIYQFDAHNWLFREYHVQSLDNGRLRGIARGERYTPTRHPIRTTVKGATYHQLEIGRFKGGWRGRVIFDL